MPPRSRNTTAALRVSATLCVLATWSLCACAPAGDVGAAATTTEDDGLYKAPPPGEDGAYLPEPEEQQGADDAGAYIPDKYETDESAGEGTYDAKKYETVEGFDDGMYHPQADLEEHDDGSYHPEIAEKTVGDDGSYHTESDGQSVGEDGSYRPEQYERSVGDDGLYNPQLYESVVGDDGAYHPDVAEKIVGDDGLYHPDPSAHSEDHEGDYNPETYEKVVGDDGSYRSTEEDDGSYHANVGDISQEDDGLYHPEIHERSFSVSDAQKAPELNAAIQLQPDVYNGVVHVGRQTPTTRVRRHERADSFQYGAASYVGHIDTVSHSGNSDPDGIGGALRKPGANKRIVRGTHSDVYRLQTLEEKMQQSDDGAYHPEKYETPAPEAAQDWDRYWTEGSVTAGGDCATPSEETSEASDDGSYRPEHHKGEDYDERADSGQNSVTPPVEPTEASDDGSYRPEQHTETPAEDYDERADNGTDWRDNVVEQHDEGTEAADDGSYRPQEHGARERRAASEDTEEVQLSPVVFHVGPKPASDVSAKASGSVSDDDASAGPPQSANLPLPAPSV
ncbi:uncharacterized protein LOC124544605 isoform X1 [Schistocerca americana]|uniref:uncharacterized protein LOC124544605 isoform X1 n=1 Tax=Schistocerca americana TaxID=7009 RepID=UPI001F4FC76D|nr:uncharacterized protein LOC124544605 isoform X1 [Schistocerca americana]